jgi:3-isopropylmalate/(R)-2-methylmalate dehydratase large subunit
VYKAIDFTGSYVENLNVAGRMTICNMAVEMGAKTAYMQPNRDVLDYVSQRAVRPYEVVFTDPGYQYAESHVFDVSSLEPELACPSSVENVHPLSEVLAQGEVKLDQGYIGSCTGGRTEDIAVAAKILKGKHISPWTRLIIVPASRDVMMECIAEGYIQDLMDAGATITTPGCGACLGAHEGILAPGEVCITSTNRNFPGRMGSTEALMYLASPATVAAGILNGRITDPRPYLE